MFWNNWKKKKEFKCSECGELHNSWPALTYNTPTPYHNLSEFEKKSIAEINNDFCIIKHKSQTDRFIRVVLKQKIHNYFDTLDYGVWVSLSEQSFNDYSDNFDSEKHEKEYFGWLCNDLANYKDTMSIPVTVVTQINNTRPEVSPHKDFDHQFVKDYYHGISKTEAEKRIHQMMK